MKCKNLQLFHYIQYESGILDWQLTANKMEIGIQSQLWIEANSNKIVEFTDDKSFEQVYISQIDGQKPFGHYQFSSPLGLFNILNSSYLVIIEECTLQATINKQQVYSINKIIFVPLKYQVQELSFQENNKILSLKKYLESGSFYFSPQNDLTQTQQQIYNKADFQQLFAWNYLMMKPFLNHSISPQWIIPIIQGYVHSYQQLFNNQSIQFTLISRVSTQQYINSATGLDHNGNVSHHIQSETLVQYKSNLYSYIIIRASVPLFCNQDKIYNSNEINQITAAKHFTKLQQQYQFKFINSINLNPSSSLLNSPFESIVKHINQPDISYSYIDFCAITKSNYEKINYHIKKLEDQFFKSKFFLLESNQLLSDQQGVFRINCQTCLDESSIFISRLNLLFVTFALKNSGFQGDLLLMYDDKRYQNLLQPYKNCWADNSDRLSQIYLGTNSLTSDYSRGKSSFMGFLNQSINQLERYVNNKFEDKTRYECVKLLLKGIENKHDQQIKQYLKSNMETYTEFNDLKIGVYTWNLGGQQQIQDLNGIFNDDVDIIIFGLQEMVDLNAKNVVISNVEKMEQQWDIRLQQQLKDYYRIESCSLVGIYLSVFSKKIDNIYKIQTETIKTGFQGTLGNKGGVIISFYCNESKIVLCNCHLTSGNKKQNERLQDIQEIHVQSKQNILESDYVFFFGDLNFRLQCNYEEAVQQIAQYKYLKNQGKIEESDKILDSLLMKDQLRMDKKKSKYLSMYNEKDIQFIPTYKYDTNSDDFDTSKKQRVPAWCDRILYYSSQNTVNCIQYERIDKRDSDHRPVKAIFELKVVSINKSIMKQTQNQFHQQQSQ